MTTQEIVAAQLSEIYGWPLAKVQDSAALITEALAANATSMVEAAE
jgi:hypothetical protein